MKRTAPGPGVTRNHFAARLRRGRAKNELAIHTSPLLTISSLAANMARTKRTPQKGGGSPADDGASSQPDAAADDAPLPSQGAARSLDAGASRSERPTAGKKKRPREAASAGEGEGILDATSVEAGEEEKEAGERSQEEDLAFDEVPFQSFLQDIFVVSHAP